MQVERSAAEDPQPVRRLIDRPRLTSILDGSKARLLLLHAPAGYGKTTLARQWLARRRHVWYAAGPAASDVAALAASIADLCSEVIAGSGERMRDRLRVTPSPADDADVLGEMLAEDVADWPHDVWLAIDDYQYAAVSDASEAFMETLVRNAPLRLLATSREKPRWATARRQMYGELLELGATHLAMTEEEAATVLGDHRDATLVKLANGWPAVIGLAVHSGEPFPSDPTLATTLYEFIAQELFEAIDSSLRWDLCKLAAISVEQVARSDATVVRAAVQRGFLIENGAKSEVHPLLRSFLERKLQDHDPAVVTSLIESLCDEAGEEERWDDAFDLIQRFDQPKFVPRLLESAFLSLLDQGRLSTIRQWTDYARSRGIASPILDLSDGETALLEGRAVHAEALTSRAARSLRDQRLVSFAYRRAGTSAILAGRSDAAMEYQQHAAASAVTASDKREALILRLNSGRDTGADHEVVTAMTQLESLPEATADDALRSLAPD
jgi:serine/threonine-protein kinase PknK